MKPWILLLCTLFIGVNVPAASANEPVELDVVLQKQYVDGQCTEVTHREKIYAMEDFWSVYHDWEVVSQNQEEIILKQEIPDISPALKEDGYFGIYKGKLTIFEGRPDNHQAVQSFYEINSGKLESHQAKELQQGIKINSKQIYDEVLEAYRSKDDTAAITS